MTALCAATEQPACSQGQDNPAQILRGTSGFALSESLLRQSLAAPSTPGTAERELRDLLASVLQGHAGPGAPVSCLTLEKATQNLSLVVKLQWHCL